MLRKQMEMNVVFWDREERKKEKDAAGMLVSGEGEK